jgi:tRNA1Val (adenine37-N6)-methyltransferase
MTLLNDAGSSSEAIAAELRGLILTQPDRGYRYSLDPFLLAAFSRPRRGERILDLGAGAGVIGLLLARRHPTVRVVGIEFLPALARHAGENARANHLAERCHVIRADLREAQRFLPPEHFHRVVANPPYRKVGSGETPRQPERAAARQESTFGIADLARVSAALLRFGGALDVIHVAERLPELFSTLAASGIEPKVLRLVAPFSGSPPGLCLVTAVKGGRPGLRVLPQLCVHAEPGEYTAEVLGLLGTIGAGIAARSEKPQTDK